MVSTVHAKEAPTVEIYTPDQAAKLLQVNVQTLRRWLRRGEITGSDTPAGWRLTPADLEAWLEKHRPPKKAESTEGGHP